MDKSNKIIQLNPPSVPREAVDQIKEVVDYIIDNAPPEALRDFSKQFLTEAFERDEDKFEQHYKSYRKYRDSSNPGYGQLLNFSAHLGVKECP